MPRSSSEGGGGNNGLFRLVFARSPLGQSTLSEDTIPIVNSTTSRSTSWTVQQRAGSSYHVRSGSDHDSEIPVIKPNRQRSYSHRERKRPSLSISKLSLHMSPDLLSPSPTSPTVDTLEQSYSSLEDSFGRILHHGEAQISHSGWRKKYEYLVLTEYYLFRFKSPKKASEMFPWILPANAHMYRPDSAASVHSVHDVEPSSGTESPTEISSINTSSISLCDIIATQFVSDNRIRVGIEIVRQSQGLKGSSSLSLFVDRQGGQPHWIESLNAAAQNAQRKRRVTSVQEILPLVKEAVKYDIPEFGYDLQKQLFLVHRRQNQVHENTPAYEELSKDLHALVFLLIGKFRVHLITVPKPGRGSSKSLSENSKILVSSYGLVSLTYVSVSEKDDSFDLIFRYVQLVTRILSRCFRPILRFNVNYSSGSHKDRPFLWRWHPSILI
jgi:hypothetical protein